MYAIVHTYSIVLIYVYMFTYVFIYVYSNIYTFPCNVGRARSAVPGHGHHVGHDLGITTWVLMLELPTGY